MYTMGLTLRSQTLSESPNFGFPHDPVEPKAQHDTNLPLIQWQQPRRKVEKFRNLMVRGRATFPNKSVSTFLLSIKDEDGEIVDSLIIHCG